MKKVKYIGRVSRDLTKDKIYDVIEYYDYSSHKHIKIKNDRGVYDIYFLHYPFDNTKFEDASVQYRNEVISEILA